MKLLKLTFAALMAFLVMVNKTTLAQNTTTITKTTSETNESYGWNKRFGLIVGGGVSFTVNKLYAEPVVDKSTNYVTMETATFFKPNLTVGFSFTPRVKSIERVIQTTDGPFSRYEYEPSGFSMALFVNPLSLSNSTTINPANSVDLGLGLGYKFPGGMAIYLTNEYFISKQPREYFVNQFGNNNTAYVVNGETQTAIDINDNSIFTSSVGVAFGIKFCYSFDIVKNLVANSKFEKVTSQNNSSGKNNKNKRSSNQK